MKSGTMRADLGVAIFVLVLAGLIFFGAVSIAQTPMYAAISAKFVPYLCALLLAVLGGFLMLDALRGGWSRHLPDADGAALNWTSFSLLVAGAVANMALIGTLGFVISASIQFVLTARAFGSQKLLRDVLIGCAITLGAYLGFDRGLGVNIGAGILEGLI